MAKVRKTFAGTAVLSVVIVFGVGVFQLLTQDSSTRELAVVESGSNLEAAGDGANDAIEMSGPSVAVPTRDVRGVLVGYPHTTAGARAAAVTWIAVTARWMTLGPIALPETVREIASAATADGLVAQFESNRYYLGEALGGDPSRLMWIEAPLQVQARSYEGRDDLMQVAVWSVLMIGNPEAGGTVDALYRTHVIEMVWERDDWRLVSSAEREGPTPVSVAGMLPGEVAEFVPVAAWQPATRAEVN